MGGATVILQGTQVGIAAEGRVAAAVLNQGVDDGGRGGDQPVLRQRLPIEGGEGDHVGLLAVVRDQRQDFVTIEHGWFSHSVSFPSGKAYTLILHQSQGKNRSFFEQLMEEHMLLSGLHMLLVSCLTLC